MKKQNLIQKALKFAKEKHKEQFRADGKTPYLVHPVRVAKILKKFKKSHRINELIAAALLHDTIEDTKTGINELRENFGETVALLVVELTNDLWKIKKVGKTNYHSEKLSSNDKMSKWALAIKLADRLDNISDLKSLPKGEAWSKKYKKQTEDILSYLEKNRELTNTHKRLIAEIRKKLSS